MSSSSIEFGPRNRKCLEIWRCNTSLKKYYSFAEWSDHVQKDHMDKLECVVCDLKFNLLTEVLTHQWKHHLETSFQCLECSEYFNTKRQFTVHECVIEPLEMDGWMQDAYGFFFLPTTPIIYSLEFHLAHPEYLEECPDLLERWDLTTAYHEPQKLDFLRDTIDNYYNNRT